MMLKKLNSLRRKLGQLDAILHELHWIRLALGRIEQRQYGLETAGADVCEFKAFSQWGEDGIIQWLIHHINISRPIFIEFGVQNYVESNTRFLLINNNWSGLVIDGSKENVEYIKHDEIYWRYNLKAACNFITAENINDIFRENGIEGKIGLLSIDIDGNDYWVWKAIDAVEPDIVICEYNHIFGKDRSVVVPYDPGFMREKAHPSCLYFGASIQAFVALAQKKGYGLVACNRNGNNLFFVKKVLLNDIVRERQVEDVFVHGQFREGRMPDGRLAFFSLEQAQEILNSLPVLDISNDEDGI